MTYQPIILSYHRFTEDFDDYPFSRTYEQFGHDLSKKIYDQIHIDDGDISMIKACELMRSCNIRAKLFIPTSLVGMPGYCSWEELKELSKYHDLESHSHNHVDLTKISLQDVEFNVMLSTDLITEYIGRRPRYIAGPWNLFNDEVRRICIKHGLIPVEGRLNIKNDSK